MCFNVFYKVPVSANFEEKSPLCLDASSPPLYNTRLISRGVT